MGIFQKEICCLCNKDAGTLKSKILSGDYICSNCLKEYNLLRVPIKNMSKDKLFEYLDKRNELYTVYENMEITKQFKGNGYLFQVDDNNKMFAVSDNKDIGTLTLYNFDDIIDYEYIEDGKTLAKGGLGTALVGGALFGGAGAIVGAGLGKKTKDVVFEMYINISINDPINNRVKITLLNTETKRGGFIYKVAKEEAQKIISCLDYITSSININIPRTQNASPLEQIKQLKELLDIGAITQEEFDTKKIELLNK